MSAKALSFQVLFFIILGIRVTYRRPWYFRTGLLYVRIETQQLDKICTDKPKIWTYFNLSKLIGIAVDAGAAFQLSYEEIRKEPGEIWNWPILPSLG